MGGTFFLSRRKVKKFPSFVFLNFSLYFFLEQYQSQFH
ncbi:hypothetical protein LEP1GSC196_2497 [Leptospira meyeri serovar Semaranga str. Veldrot Semarang 173]|nr:hypothetical protein LEP1GSC196_2497 [Leptospira meyeri serovar Semaranga str. Veldrot Semarang 173]